MSTNESKIVLVKGTFLLPEFIIFSMISCESVNRMHEAPIGDPAGQFGPEK